MILNYQEGPKSRDECPYKKEVEGHDTAGRGQGHVKKEAETGLM